MRIEKEQRPLEESDKAFFHHFFEENKRLIFSIAMRYARNKVDCEDLVQNSLLRLMHNISTLRELNRCKTATYIVLTIRTAYLDSEKQKRKENLIFMDDEALEALMVEKLISQDRDNAISAKQAVDKLKTVLSPREWCILEGKYILGLSQKELGSLLGVAPDSVRMVLHRARTKAKAVLKEDSVWGGEVYE